MSTDTLDRPRAEEVEPEPGADDDVVEPGEPEPSPEEDDEEERDEEQPAEPEPAAPPSSEAMMRALEKEHTRHERGLRKIMGESFDAYDDCPVCMTMGYVFGSVLADDDSTEACPKCKGFGALKTASLVEQHQARQCMTCMGNGYVTKTPEPTLATQLTAGVPAAITVNPAADPEVERLRAQGYTVLPPYVAPPSTTP